MSLLDKIDKENVPQHVAIIMDGNGRWAKSKGLDRTEGHKEAPYRYEKWQKQLQEHELNFLLYMLFLPKTSSAHKKK